ncbi:MAG: AtpZ/AtpI family protein [Microgenomates group bacterium]|nr:AtpZ/AtpI family protein [Microgenomates group bacterium]
MVGKKFIVNKNFEILETKTIDKKKKFAIIKNNQLGLILNIGFYLATPIIIGVFLGLLIDNWLKTNSFVLLGVFFGALGSFYNIYKIYQKFE